MSKQTPKKEENNTTQKIIGRSSNEEIKNRHEAYCKLRKIYPTLSKGEFINKVTAYFIKNKIRVCKDALKFNEEDIVVQEELKQYEFALFTLKFCDTLVVKQIKERSK